MQPVSEVYNPYPDERWSNIRVTFELIDVDAAENATVTATSESDISRLEQTHNRILPMSNKLATLEHNYFVLDGSLTLPDAENNGEVGWWSGEISGDNCVFAIPQILEFNFTELQSSVGFVVVFDESADEYASDFKIEVFDSSNSLVSEDNVAGNTISRYVSDMPVDGYRRVRITFTKTSKPRRRVRVSEVAFGVIQTFTRDNTTSLKVLYEQSPSMENLPTNELTITIENIDRKYNMINPNGLYKYLQQGQGMDVEIGVGDSRNSLEYVNMGRFYFANSSAEDNAITAQITAYDRFYALDRGLYRKGVNSTGTVFEIVNDIISDSGMVLTISMTPEISSRVIGRNIPVVSHREALRMVAQAARCICYINRSDVLVFEKPLIAEPSDTLHGGNLSAPAKVGVSEYINTVEVKATALLREYGASPSKIFESAIPIYGTKEIWITYDCAEITSSSIAGGTINSATYYLYACKMTITAAAGVTLTLNGYSMSERETLYRARNLDGNAESIKTYDNPLIRSDFAQEFADWLLAIEQGRISYAMQGRGNPATEIGDTVTIYDAYGENRNAAVVKQEYQYDGTLKAETTARGIDPFPEV